MTIFGGRWLKRERKCRGDEREREILRDRKEKAERRFPDPPSQDQINIQAGFEIFVPSLGLCINV